MDAHKNFAYSTVATPPSPAASGTSLGVAAGDGVAFPAPPFNVTIWPASAIPVRSNAEVARCTGLATDTMTITRAQEGSSARAIVAGDQIAATVTDKMVSDLDDALIYKGDWAAGSYNDGDIVVYNGQLYICTQDGITAAPAGWPVLNPVSYIQQSIIDAAGDLLVGSADNVIAKLPVGTLGQVLTRVSTAPFVGWQTPAVAPTAPGTQLDYAQITAQPAAVTASTEATAVAIITGNLVTYDGTRVKIEFYAPGLDATANANLNIVLLRDSTVIGYGQAAVSATGFYYTIDAFTFDTPPAGAHTYSVSAFRGGGGNPIIHAGPGGSGNVLPAYLRVTKA